MAYFENLVGQSLLKRKLGFYLDAFCKTRKMPFLMFGGARGSGKTQFARETAKHMKTEDGSDRLVLEVNCSIFKNLKTFFEGLYIPFIANANREINILWDESHNLPQDISQALLTICNSDPNPIRTMQYGDSVMTFDFQRMSFFFMTTETDKIFPPLKDRLETVDFEAYNKDELKKIIILNTKAKFIGDVLDTIADNVRGNARSCVKMAENITTYCGKNRKDTFSLGDWTSLKFSLGIMPYGLTSSEIGVLRELKARGPCSLTMLASATGQSRTALKNDVEQQLLRLDFLRIDGKRQITEKGLKVLELV